MVNFIVSFINLPHPPERVGVGLFFQIFFVQYPSCWDFNFNFNVELIVPSYMHVSSHWYIGNYHNLNLGLTTQAKVCKGASQEGSPRVTSHIPENVGECEGMNPHTPKWAPTLRVGI